MDDLFWAKVEVVGDCWLWRGALTYNGYGRLRRAGRNWQAHRYAYVSAVGEIPSGLEIDHLCRTRNCVNPEHLEAVTRQENTRRSPLLGRGNRRKTHCPQGHPYDEANTYHWRGSRHCRSCDAERKRNAA